MTLTLILSLLSCTEVKAPECSDNGDCADGEACISQLCEKVGCVTSSDCELQSFCNPLYECESGCESDDDCVAGESCNKDEHECSPYGCRSTELDCEYGEFCNTESGECEERGQDCETCNATNINACGPGAYCLATTTGNDGYCWDTCEDESDCPRGFQCLDWTDTPGYDKICFADCDYLTENGLL